jgi:HipA-like C-terminal domain
MRIAPKVQTATFDIADWVQDAEFGVFPQGARAKDAVFAPDKPSDAVLVASKRYLFKRSKRSYPDQFWGEVIAYRVGCLLGLQVPPAFVAFNSKTGHSAALIEWFYAEGVESFIMGGDFLHQLDSDYDRDKGTKHNLGQIEILMRAMYRTGTPVKNWRQWWVDALLFDALIGNTDRHQDNWGLVFQLAGDKLSRCRLSPLYDNGTSLGHERFVERVQDWSDADIDRYIQKGTHHVKWSLQEKPVINRHTALLRRAILAWPKTIEIARSRLNFHADELVACSADLVDLPTPIALTPARIAFVQRLLKRRHQLLIKTVDDTYTQLDELRALVSHR